MPLPTFPKPDLFKSANPTQQSVAAQIEEQRNKVKNNAEQLNRANFFRIPFVLDCVKWRQETIKRKLVFKCNPSDVNFSFPLRGATQKVKIGMVFYWWKNAIRNSHFDVPVVTFTFQSGNVVPMRGNNPDTLYIPEGVDNYYEYMSLIDEDRMLSDGTPNFVYIQHNSAIFPSLQLTGFFDPSRETTVKETAGDGHFSWEGAFFVHDSTPAFNSGNFAQQFKTIFTNSATYNPAFASV